ncbi:Uncharacterised protein [Serratia marcescens]|nr:Uncharacterised protein [Serratia marcescens]CVD01882.1 Uncharacterised protein [Serratia marcescens]CVD54032.1 Uncharacterised protein [Serratia marcescens]CVG66120.1 Uncharacterised protein [Serratia marcescens]
MIEQYPALLRLGAVQLIETFLGKEEIGSDHFQAVGGGKLLGAFGGKQHVFAIFQHRARRQHRVADAADAGDGAGIAGAAVHHAGIKLVGALMGKHRAFAGVEQRALFEQPHRFGHRVQRAAALGQYRLPGGHDLGQRLDILPFFFRTQRRPGNCARAAMNGNHWFAHLPDTLC